jgi:hypothetical protein
MIPDDEYYEIMNAIKSSKNQEHILLLRDMLGDCSFLADGYIGISNNIVVRYTFKLLCCMINTKFPKLEDKIVIKWRLYESLYHIHKFHNIYIEDNIMKYLSKSKSETKLCLSESEFEYIKLNANRIGVTILAEGLLNHAECYMFDTIYSVIHGSFSEYVPSTYIDNIKLCRKHVKELGCIISKMDNYIISKSIIKYKK